MIELFDCIPMNARITQAQCEKNRTRKDNVMIDVLYDARCSKCAGLIKSEVSAMPICKVDGCTKHVQKLGKCKAHLNGTEPRRSYIRKPDGNVANVANVVNVSAAADEIKNIDYLAFLRQKYDERFEECVSRLNTARTPYERAALYLRECDAIIGLGV